MAGFKKREKKIRTANNDIFYLAIKAINTDTKIYNLKQSPYEILSDVKSSVSSEKAQRRFGIAL